MNVLVGWLIEWYETSLPPKNMRTIGLELLNTEKDADKLQLVTIAK